MKASLFAAALAAGSAYAAEQRMWQQCGGRHHKGSRKCTTGAVCKTWNPYYAQCIPGTSSSFATAPTAYSYHTAPSMVPSGILNATSPINGTSVYVAPATGSMTSVATTSTAVAPVTSSVIAAYSSVGSAPSSYAAPSTSTAAATSSAAASSSTAAAPTSSVAMTTSSAAASSSAAATSASSSAAASSTGKVSFAGVNIAGFDFGCGTDGTCTTSSVYPPGTSGKDQMVHFVTKDGLNAFRLPVAWQYLVNSQLGGTLDATNLAAYDTLVQDCLSSGAAMCLIDIHNYARWDGSIIGQGGPTNAQFASLWSQIATKYKAESKVAFGIMNEPHDIPNITTWAASVQAAVTAIRQAGATTQKILLPGSDYTSAATFISNGSGPALLKVTNLDGSTTNLIFDVHRYLDSDNSGTSATCTTNNVAVFQTLGDWLRTNKRQALLSETGGGSSDSTCLTNLCQELAELNTYSDVFLGWLGWAAGSFATSYVLSETPTGTAGNYVDQPLVSTCIVGMFK